MDLGAVGGLFNAPPASAVAEVSPTEGGWLRGSAKGAADFVASLAANPFVRDFVLVVLAVLVAILFAALVRAIFAGLGRRLAERGFSGGLRLFSLELASPGQLRAAAERLLSALRLLAYVTIAAALVWALFRVVVPSTAAEVLDLLRGLWLSLVAVLLLLTLVRALHAAAASLVAAIGRKEHDIRPLRFGGFTILPAPVIEKGLVLAIKTLGWAVALVLAATAVTLILSFFSFTWSWSKALLGFFFAVINPIVVAVLSYVPKLLFAAVIVVIARLLLRLFKTFFSEIEAGRLVFAKFQPDWAPTTYKILRALIVALTVVMIFPYIPGSGTDAFKSVGIFLGVILSLGSSSFVGNVMAGVSLSYMNSFRPGDRVKVGETTGDVLELTLLVTRIRTIKNVVVTIPNSVVLSKDVENFSHRAGVSHLILHTTVTIGYDVPWREVHAALLGAASGVRGLLADPPPFVLQLMLDSFSVAYELNASTDEPRNMAIIYSDLHQAIQDRFAEAGIEILTPTYQSLRDGSASTIPDVGP